MTPTSLIKAIRAAGSEREALDILTNAAEPTSAGNDAGQVSTVTMIDPNGSPGEIGRQIWGAMASPIQMVLASLPAVEGQANPTHMIFWTALIHEAMSAMVADMGTHPARGLAMHMTQCRHLEEVQAAPSDYVRPEGHQVH